MEQSGVAILALLISFLLSAVFCPLLIPVLRKLKFGQQVREEGNPEHLKKQGTPTMGGIAFLAAILLTSIIFSICGYTKLLPVLILTLCFGIIGFIDDYLKVVKKQSEGFKAWQKLLCQIAVTAAFILYCVKTPEIGTSVILPFTGGKSVDFGIFYWIFAFFVILGTDNGVNFTDGVDGLCTSVTIIVALFLMLVSKNISADYSILSGIVAGALLGFLISNAHPAKVFMGDTGSLALGGFVAGMALVLQMGWFVILFGLIYFAEVLSVILQVGYFKLTHGKRIFKMAPIHHHFELSGYSETQVVALFSIVTVLMVMISYWAM